MGSATDFTEAQFLDFHFASSAPSRPAGLWLGLFTTAPSDAGGGTEVSGNAYARLATTRGTDWSRTGSTVTNATTLTFATPTGSWGTVTHFALFDAASGGNALWWAPLVASQTVSTGNTVSAEPGQITFSAS